MINHPPLLQLHAKRNWTVIHRPWPAPFLAMVVKIMTVISTIHRMKTKINRVIKDRSPKLKMINKLKSKSNIDWSSRLSYFSFLSNDLDSTTTDSLGNYSRMVEERTILRWTVDNARTTGDSKKFSLPNWCRFCIFQLSCITLPPNLLDILKELAGIHKTVSLSIEGLWEQDRDLITLIKALTKAVNTLVNISVSMFKNVTLSLSFSQIRGFPLYEGYTQMNLTATRKALEKKMNSKDFSSEGKFHRSFRSLHFTTIHSDLLSIPTKQFLQILSQVQVEHLWKINLIERDFLQDLYQTAQTCDTGDKEQIHQLYEFAQKCKSVRVCSQKDFLQVNRFDPRFVFRMLKMKIWTKSFWKPKMLWSSYPTKIGIDVDWYSTPMPLYVALGKRNYLLGKWNLIIGIAIFSSAYASINRFSPSWLRGTESAVTHF